MGSLSRQLKMMNILISMTLEDTIIEIIFTHGAQLGVRNALVFGLESIYFCKILASIKNIQEIIFLDVNSENIEHHLQKFWTNIDNPNYSHASLYLGIGHISYPDFYIRGSDLVICMDVLQHFTTKQLESLPFNIFGYVQPELFVVSMLNNEAESYKPCGMISWSKYQFFDWCNNLCKRFKEYSVIFYPVGHLAHSNVTDLDKGVLRYVAVFSRDSENHKKNFITNDQVIDDFIKEYISYGIMSETKDEHCDGILNIVDQYKGYHYIKECNRNI